MEDSSGIVVVSVNEVVGKVKVISGELAGSLDVDVIPGVSSVGMEVTLTELVGSDGLGVISWLVG